MMEAFKVTGAPVAPIPTVVPGNTPIYQRATDVGHRTLWVVFVLQALSSIAFYALAFRQPVQKRLFHVLTAFITTFAAIAYFAMAVGDGVYDNEITIKESQKHVPDTFQTIYREVYWARYVDWSITTPLLLLDLALLAGLSGANITVAITADLIMILNGLFAALTNDVNAKWGYYAIAIIAYLVVVYQLAINGRHIASTKDSKTATFFAAIGGFTLILWTLYPIVWGIADGARKINVDSEIIAYGVLDVLSKSVFGFWLLFTHDSLSSTANVEGFWAHGLVKDGAIRVGDDDEGA